MDIFEKVGEAATSPGVMGIPTDELKNDTRKIGVRKRIIVHAIGPQGPFIVKGQTARCLTALVAAGPRGTTALETSSWALRFSAYCFDLRHKHGLDIATLREPHENGWHGRHILQTPVTIVEAGQ